MTRKIILSICLPLTKRAFAFATISDALRFPEDPILENMDLRVPSREQA